MNTTESDVAAGPAHDRAHEPGDMLVHHEVYRGCFSGNLVDHRMPCTFSEDTKCQIVACIPLWNEFFCWLELELRELPGEGGQLGVVHVPGICLPKPEETLLYQAATLLFWLLKIHHCVVSIHIPGYRVDSDVDDFKVLIGNDSLKSLSFEHPWSVDSECVCKMLLSMKRLEQLHCVVPLRDETFAKMVSGLLRASATLTVLEFIAPHMDLGQAELLLSGLQANYTVRDLTISSGAVVLNPPKFVAFMSGTATLKHLKVVGSKCDLMFGIVSWLFQGMMYNRTVSSLEVHDVWLTRGCVVRVARMLAQNKMLRSFGLWRCLPFGQFRIREWGATTLEQKGTSSWLQAISKNDTVENITLSAIIWTYECWGRFFGLLSRRPSLKRLTIVVDEDERRFLPDIARKLEESGCEEKVTIVASCGKQRLSLEDCKRYSELRTEVPNMLPQVYRELATFPSLTFLSLLIEHLEEKDCLRLFKFVSTTSTLQKMDLQIYGRSLGTKSDGFCTALSVALTRNRSITDLGLAVYADPCEGVESVGGAVARSETIRKIRLRSLPSKPCLRFLKGLESGNGQNYTLCSATLESELSAEPWLSLWFRVRQTARRNSGCVARAAQFLKWTRCDTPCAAALDRVYRHPALVAELSEALSVSEADAIVAVRERFRSIEGMHEFMRLTGVVKARVSCQPRDGGQTQLDSLNEHCWAHVRRYLQLDDVAWDRHSSWYWI